MRRRNVLRLKLAVGFHVVYSHLIYWFICAFAPLTQLLSWIGLHEQLSRPMLMAICRHAGRMDAHAENVVNELEGLDAKTD